jgi:hypothetical protein
MEKTAIVDILHIAEGVDYKPQPTRPSTDSYFGLVVKSIEGEGSGYEYHHHHHHHQLN